MGVQKNSQAPIFPTLHKPCPPKPVKKKTTKQALIFHWDKQKAGIACSGGGAKLNYGKKISNTKHKKNKLNK